MFRGIHSVRRVWQLLAISSLVSGTILAGPTPAYALSIDDYFSYSYTIALSQTEVYRDEAFSAEGSGQAVCKKKLPITPSAASVTTCITARHETTGAEVVLNSGFTVTLDSFPAEQGESMQETIVVPLAFPHDCQSGNYIINGEIVTAKVRVLTIWLDVTSYLPTYQVLGSITCHTRYVSDTGKFLMGFTKKSGDGRAAVTIRLGTLGLAAQGRPLNEITVTEKENPPPSPSDAEVVGLVYDFCPEGAILTSRCPSG